MIINNDYIHSLSAFSYLDYLKKSFIVFCINFKLCHFKIKQIKRDLNSSALP